MGLFSKKNKDGSPKKEKKLNLKISDDEERKMKTRSQNIHDPILNAVNEAQPFEEANLHQRTSSVGNGVLNDVFGNVIVNPDVSNPTRSRDERPMDTIRAFEFSITGDPIYQQQLETPTLGWRVRDDFPLYTNNPYGGDQQPQYDEYGQPIYNNNNMSRPPPVEQGVYVAPPAKEQVTKKKGIFSFGKKKKKAAE